MDRRAFLTSLGTAVSVAIAGCLGDDNERVTVVEDYFEAVNDGDMELADGLVHDNGEPPFETQRDITVGAVSELDRTEVVEATDHDLADLEESDETLVDRGEFTATAYVYGDIEVESENVEVYYRLVEDEDLWYIWTDLHEASED